MSEWKDVKNGLPDQDCPCLVWNSSRPFQYYTSFYNKDSNEFEVSWVDCIRLQDPITFNATHYIKIPTPPLYLHFNLKGIN